jgi:polysaccharide export outer membrane protein
MIPSIFKKFPALLVLFIVLFTTGADAQDNLEYPLGPGDVLRIQVFQNPDLTTETRVSENGSITYPLIGAVEVGGLSIAEAERKIADALKKGGFIKQAQVNILLLQMRGSQVSVLGQVNRPGRFPLET